MDIIAALTKDHREAEVFFAEFSSESTEEGKKRCAEQLIAELSKHDAVELEHLYPLLATMSQEGERLQRHSLEEHREARELLHTLDTSLDQVMSPSFAGEWRRLESMTKEHVQEEETEIFPLLRRNCSEEQLRELGEKVEASKKTAPTHPHPSTPDNPVGAKVMGAAAGVADRARDAVKK
jgi:hypothetical protein